MCDDQRKWLQGGGRQGACSVRLLVHQPLPAQQCNVAIKRHAREETSYGRVATGQVGSCRVVQSWECQAPY
jgi:hypothetical protein